MSVKRRMLHGMGQGLMQAGQMQARGVGKGTGVPTTDPNMLMGMDQIGDEMAMQPGEMNQQGLLRMLEQLLKGQ